MNVGQYLPANAGCSVSDDLLSAKWDCALTFVECKKYAADRKVGVAVVREVSGVHYLKKASKSMIVTTSFFSKDAKKEAAAIEHQLELKDYYNIKEWLARYAGQDITNRCREE